MMKGVLMWPFSLLRQVEISFISGVVVSGHPRSIVTPIVSCVFHITFITIIVCFHEEN